MRKRWADPEWRAKTTAAMRRHGRSHHAASPKRPAPVSHTAAISPLTSLRSARVLTGLYSAFSNPVLERLGYGMANMRLISCDAGR
jgi:hypothetical protein